MDVSSVLWLYYLRSYFSLHIFIKIRLEHAPQILIVFCDSECCTPQYNQEKRGFVKKKKHEWHLLVSENNLWVQGSISCRIMFFLTQGWRVGGSPPFNLRFKPVSGFSFNDIVRREFTHCLLFYFEGTFFTKSLRSKHFQCSSKGLNYFFLKMSIWNFKYLNI